MTGHLKNIFALQAAAVVIIVMQCNTLHAATLDSTKAKTDTSRADNNVSDSTTNKQYNNTYRLAIGAGGSFGPYDGDIEYNTSVGFIFSYQIKNFNVVSLRFLSSDGSGGIVGDQLIQDYGILYNLATISSAGLFSVGAGIEYVNKEWPKYISPNVPTQPYDTNARVTSHTIGFPYQVQALFNFSGGFGMGIIAYGDVNAIFSHIGILFCLQFGDF